MKYDKIHWVVQVFADSSEFEDGDQPVLLTEVFPNFDLAVTFASKRMSATGPMSSFNAEQVIITQVTDRMRNDWRTSELESIDQEMLSWM